ncbi:MAG: FAD-binding oxidoreductase [Gallionellaceae bacterium]|jgi:FAD/FMN-containing dehydrogenase
MPTLTKPLSGWGRYPVQSCELERPERYADLRPTTETLIARGQGRSYGDASLNENGRVILTERLDRMLSLDVQQGILKAEAGVTLAEILPVIVKQGWFLPVTPGTKYVSLGGCVAADVHGKNHHHDGGFGDHVLGIDLIMADGSHKTCSASENAEIFWATVGGMGLTGIISEVTLKLIPIQTAKMMVSQHAANNLEHLFQLLQNPALDDQYSVAWIDCLAKGGQLGRGIAMFGHHATIAELGESYSTEANPSQPPLDRGGADLAPLTKGGADSALPLTRGSWRGFASKRLSQNPLQTKPRRMRSLPFNFPSWILNPLSISLFNKLYFYRESRRKSPFLTDYDSYFYPLDSIGQWNRMYGKRGFVQYQCVIPEATALIGMIALLKELSASRRSSFLAVLKRFGAEGKAPLSFPMPGYTLALDLPIRDKGLFSLLDKLDHIVLQHGGRVYLAKDARISAESFRSMYPRFEMWLKLKNKIDPSNRFSSSMARRLNIGGKAK